MTRNARLTITLVALLLLGGAGVSIGQSPGGNVDGPGPDPDGTKDFIYTVGPDDVLTIEVYDNPDLTGDYSILSDGSITFPLLGQIKVSGQGIIEIKKMITELLEKDYLYNPIVSVTVKRYRSKKVRILGSVGRPGIYYLDSPTRLFDILSKAEGISPTLGKITRGQKARIVRLSDKTYTGDKGPGNIRTINIDLYELLVEGKEESNIYLKGGDVIYMPTKIQSVHVIGEVKQPGSFPYEEGMTVLKAVTLAGGPTKKASTKGTVIKRIENGREIEIKVGMGDLLEPDDILEVPLSFW